MAATLCWCELGAPECFYSIHQLTCVRWLDRVCQIVLQLSPNSFNRVEIWGFCRSAPPVYSISIKEAFGFTACVFRIIVLLEPMMLWVVCGYEREESSFQYFDIEVCVHDLCENNHCCCTFTGNSSPYVHFSWMFGLWFVLSWLSNLAVGLPHMTPVAPLPHQ